MKTQSLIFITITAVFLFTVARDLLEDTSKLSAGKHLKKNSDTLNATVDPACRNSKPRAGGTHTFKINPNSGTVIPNTTSGTLNSNVNPNTQL